MARKGRKQATGHLGVAYIQAVPIERFQPMYVYPQMRFGSADRDNEEEHIRRFVQQVSMMPGVVRAYVYLKEHRKAASPYHYLDRFELWFNYPDGVYVCTIEAPHGPDDNIRVNWIGKAGVEVLERNRHTDYMKWSSLASSLRFKGDEKVKGFVCEVLIVSQAYNVEVLFTMMNAAQVGAIDFAFVKEVYAKFHKQFALPGFCFFAPVFNTIGQLQDFVIGIHPNAFNYSQGFSRPLLVEITLTEGNWFVQRLAYYLRVEDLLSEKSHTGYSLAWDELVGDESLIGFILQAVALSAGNSKAKWWTKIT